MKDLVEESISILSGGQDISAFGELLNEGWQAKRSLSAKVSNSQVDAIYARAISAGALGGKLTGAGGGGFMLLFVPPPARYKVREVLNKLLHVPFKFESSGSQIIFYDPQEDYSALEKDRAMQEIDPFKELSCMQVKQEELA
jgi:D-glycero-alpha-D-manno-heptose-7-phosphate kinase